MKKKIFHNLILKLLSVALAVVLWFFVTYRGQLELSIEAPVEFKNIPKGLEIYRQSIKKISVNVKGNERLLKGVNPADVRAIADLSNAKKGENTIFFDSDDISAPRSLKVLKIEPKSIKVSLDEYVSKKVPVHVSITGSPGIGYKIKSIDVKPGSVEIEGPRSEVERVYTMRTEAMDITGINADVSNIVKLNPNGRNIRLKVSEAAVRVRIVKVKQ